MTTIDEAPVTVQQDSEPLPVGTRICIIGDGLVSGVGDPRSLGWTGRVAARTPMDDEPMSIFSLGIPDEPTEDLVTRWRAECNLRWHVEATNRLVIGLGRADLYAGLTTTKSRLNLANILDDAAGSSISTMVVGPPPVHDPSTHDDVADLAAAFADVCDRRDVPYVDCFGPLASHEQWYADLADSDGYNPGQAGYGMMAWLVLHNGWYSWLGQHQH